jgi:hypothetical protein
MNTNGHESDAVEAKSVRRIGSPLFSVEQENGRMPLLAIPAGCQKVAGG